MSPKTPRPPPEDPALSAIEDAATEWIIRRDRGLAPTQERALTAWLAADPRHAAMFTALEETWQLMGESPPVDSRKILRFPRWLPAGLAAAAAIALAVLWAWPSSSRSEPYALVAATEIGAVRQLNLPDGSFVRLNTDSEVDVRYTEAERRVQLLRGEAHFTVAKNARRPFVVHAAGLDVRAVGTAFNVHLRAEQVEVLVTEGRVRLEEGVEPVAVAANPEEPNAGAGEPSGPQQRSPEVVAGQRATVVRPPVRADLGVERPSVVAPVIVPVKPEVIRQVLAWHEQRLDFESTRLTDMVSEINRYSPHKLVIVDPRLGEQRFGGSFPAGDYETVVLMLETNFNVVAERRGGETWLRLKDDSR